jgi:hypothetical protein
MPLAMRPTLITNKRSETPDYVVLSGGLSVGRIYEDVSSLQESSRWYWTIYGVHAGPNVMAIQGHAATLDEAKATLRENWAKWLAWAKLEEVAGEN